MCLNIASIAQLVERPLSEQEVVGSNFAAAPLGLPRLRNLVNVYTSSNNRNNSVYTELPDLIF